jgi:hypothetical protein
MQRRENDLSSFEKLRQVIASFHATFLLLYFKNKYGGFMMHYSGKCFVTQ